MTTIAHPPPVPLVVLVGFLGAGKTSLLRALLPMLRERGVAPQVVINDYRNALVDARTLDGLADAVHPIHGTCICCDSREDLMNAVAAMPLPPNSVLLLEANGTADAPELVEILTADRRARRFSLPILIGVVDAKRWQKRYWHNGLESEQVRAAVGVMVTRRDEVTDERWDKVVAGLRDAAPGAELITPRTLAERLVELTAHSERLPRRRFAPPVLGAPAEHHASHHAHTHHFASMEIPLKTRVTRDALTAFLNDLPPEVIRAKGVAFLQGEPLEAVLFQKVEGRENAAFMTLPRPERLDPVAVLIGARFPRGEILAAAARHLGLEPALP